MERRDVDRITEAKYSAFVEQILARLKSPPEAEAVPCQEADRLVEQLCLEVVRSCSEAELELLWRGSDALWKHKDDNPSSPTDWEAGVLKELHDRVRYAAGDAGLEGDGKEEPGGGECAPSFRFDDDDLIFLSKVARGLTPLTARPGLPPEDAKTIRRAVAALKKLPELTPGIDVQIEVSHRMGGEGFSQSYCYAVRLERQRIEISSTGSQSNPAGGSESFSLESLLWQADGQTAYTGNRDTWLERLAYALTRPYTLKVTGEGAAGKS